MADSKKALALAVVLVVAAALAVAAHAVCDMNNDDFMACQPAAAATTAPSPGPGPSEACCATLGKADLRCLCTYKNSPWLSLYNIDPKRAMELPAKCGLATPPDC